MLKVIDEYEIEAEGVIVNVEILEFGSKAFKYKLILQEIGLGTEALLDQIRQKLVLEVDVSTTEILDPKVINYIKTKFKRRAEELISSKLPTIDEDTKSYLISMLLHEIIGLGKIEFLINDPDLEEIIINSSSEPVRVYHKTYGWLLTNVVVPTEEQIQNYANIIARRVGRQISTLSPLLDAQMVTGDRTNAVLYPIAHKGNTITIRKFARDPWTMIDFINVGTYNKEVLSMIWIAMEYEMNILISGGTGSGKTSLLGTILAFIPPFQRVLTIEDTRELQLPKSLYWCPLLTRPANTEGKGEVNMLHLLVNALRMRPDRIILGEMRKQAEAEVLFEAMHTGHSVYATVHADTVSETITRLVNPPISTPANLLSAINLVVVQFRDRRKGIRRTFQVGEFIPEETDKGVEIKGNIMYRWKPSTDKIVPHSEGVRFFEELSRHTGFNTKEILANLKERQEIIQWMIDFKVKGIKNIGKLMTEYYYDKENIVNHTLNKIDPKDIFEKEDIFKEG